MSWATSGDGSSPLIKDPAAELVAFGGTGAAGVGAARACKSWECKRDIGAGHWGGTWAAAGGSLSTKSRETDREVRQIPEASHRLLPTSVLCASPKLSTLVC